MLDMEGCSMYCKPSLVDGRGGPCQDATGRGREEGGGAEAGRANLAGEPDRIETTALNPEIR